MKYVVLIEESLATELTVDAGDVDGAIAMAMEEYYTCEVVLGSENLVGVSFSVKEN